MSLSPRDVLGYDLAPDWYPGLNAVLGIVTLAFLVAGTIAITNSGVSDYHRKASWQRDGRWSSFVDRQKDHRQNDS